MTIATAVTEDPRPGPGDIVRVRSRRWLVEEVVPPAVGGQSPIVRLACADGHRAAVMDTLVESCKAAKVEPFAYLTALLTRLPSATGSEIADVTPLAWAATRRG